MDEGKCVTPEGLQELLCHGLLGDLAYGPRQGPGPVYWRLWGSKAEVTRKCQEGWVCIYVNKQYCAFVTVRERIWNFSPCQCNSYLPHELFQRWVLLLPPASSLMLYRGGSRSPQKLQILSSGIGIGILLCFKILLAFKLLSWGFKCIFRALEILTMFWFFYTICLLVLSKDCRHCKMLGNDSITFPLIMSLCYLLSELKTDFLFLWQK